MTEGTGRGWDRPGSRMRPDRRPSVTRRSRRKGGRSRGGRPRRVEAEPELAVAAAGAPVTASSCPAKLSKAAQRASTLRCRGSSPFTVADGRGAGWWSRARGIAAAAVARTRADAVADGRAEARWLMMSVAAEVSPNEVRGGGRGSPVLPAVQVSVRAVLGLPDQPRGAGGVIQPFGEEEEEEPRSRSTASPLASRRCRARASRSARGGGGGARGDGRAYASAVERDATAVAAGRGSTATGCLRRPKAGGGAGGGGAGGGGGAVWRSAAPARRSSSGPGLLSDRPAERPSAGRASRGARSAVSCP